MIRFFDSAVLRNSMDEAVRAFPGKTSNAGRKVPFLDISTALQGVSLRYKEDDYIIDFSNDSVLNFLRHHKVIVDDDLKENSFFSEEDSNLILSKFDAAVKIIEEADPELLALVRQLIGSFAIYDIRNKEIEGGSVSGCVGMVYLCPERSWTPEFLAEMMVHEYVHNALFLDDMVNGIFPDLLLLKDDEAKVISSIRQTKREYDKSFHAACVSSALAYFYHKLGDNKKSDEFLAPLDTTVRELNDVDRKLASRGDNVITDVARGIKSDLTRFVADRNFSRFFH